MGEMTQTVKAARRLWGSIEAGPDHVTIAGLGSATEIRYERISSVRSDWWHGTIDLETGAEVHHVAVWNPFKLAALKAAINDHVYSGPAVMRKRYADELDLALGGERPRPLRRSIAEVADTASTFVDDGRVRVDDGGPGEEGTFRTRAGAPYLDTEPSEFVCARCGIGRVRFLTAGLADDCLTAEPPAPHDWTWTHELRQAQS